MLDPLPEGCDPTKHNAMLRSWMADLSWTAIDHLTAPAGSVEGGHEILQAFRDHGVGAKSICGWIMGRSESPFGRLWAD